MMQRFPLGKYLAINIFLWGALLMCQGTVPFKMFVHLVNAFYSRCEELY
jgi:hypothetical protein